MKNKILLGMITFMMIFSLIPSTVARAEANGVQTTQAQTYSNDIVISPSITSEYTITTGGTYTLEGGTYAYGIGINTTEEVIINIAGDIEYTSTTAALVNLLIADCNVTMNAYDCSINSAYPYIVSRNYKVNLTINGGTYTDTHRYLIIFLFENGGTFNFNNITFEGQLYAKDATVTVNNSSCAVIGSGADISFENCDVTLNNLTSFGQIQFYESNVTVNGGLYTYDKVLFVAKGGEVCLNDVTAYSSGSYVLYLRKLNTIPKVTITGGTYEGNPTKLAIANVEGGTLTVKDATINNTTIRNDNSILNIEKGTIMNGVDNLSYTIHGGTVNFNGGIVNGNNSQASIVDIDSSDIIEINTGKISGSKYGASITQGGTLKIGVNAIVEGNDADVYLGANNTFIVKEGYGRKLSVAVEDTIPENTKRQITVADSNANDLDYQKKLKVVSADSSYSVNYDETGKYLYLWKHTHTWDYTVNGNKMIAKCTSHSDCMYYDEGLEVQVKAENMTYSGEKYDLGSIINDITDITGDVASEIKYVGRVGTSYDSMTAPTNAGQYTASVTIGGKTVTKDFEIARVKVNKPQGDNTQFTHNGQNQTYQIVDNALYTVTGNVQKDAGSYTVTVSLKDTVNYEWNDGTTDVLIFAFNIEPKKETKPDETETEATKPESKPEEINSSETKPTTEKTEEIVNTGDSTHMMFYSMMMLLSVLGISLSIMRRNRG